MTSAEIRNTFLDFFHKKGHAVIPSAPIVVKNDPTLMFTNAGMNQFKDIFLGNNPEKYSRVADTQKCLRVSGKHNDLEDVGIDSYHHTMFEMLGNWSFGDGDAEDSIGKGYFKKEAIEWAWELLTGVYKIPGNRLYATVFEGNKKENVEPDHEAFRIWEEIIGAQGIIFGSKKDNFWEMGDTGPCGPCSEIHIDLRPDEERKKVNGKSLVNTGNPQVIELWNLVFIQYNRLTNGKLTKLPAKHIDTGMGFERLCMVIQEKSSNYDTDIFLPLLQKIENLSGIRYGSASKTDIAFRVIADHSRALAFTIPDGQIPSNTGAGYVIRRILRRAVRYGYSALNLHQPFLYEMIPVLAQSMGAHFPELKSEEELIKKVIYEEEESFLHTLEKGLKRLDQIILISRKEKQEVIDGKSCFELYDTYGFPMDLTALILREQGLTVDEKGFNEALKEQKDRSRKATAVAASDWVKIMDGRSRFVGYDLLNTEANLVQHRKVKAKNSEFYQLVFNITPFYPEGGGQVGDSGIVEFGNEKIQISDTLKENETIVHITDRLPSRIDRKALLRVDEKKRAATACNHSATHLLHAALRQALGTHVQQKGSLVSHEQLSFDFSHFEKVSDSRLADIEMLVNRRIRDNIAGQFDVMPLAEAKKLGAMALFGEKYGDMVRVVSFDKNYSVELCGGTHVRSTGEIGFFKITGESAVAAGIRRIYGVTAAGAEAFIRSQTEQVRLAADLLKSQNLPESVKRLLEENQKLRKHLEAFEMERVAGMKDVLLGKKKEKNGLKLIIEKIPVQTAEQLKTLAVDLKNSGDDFVVALGAEIDSRPQIALAVSGNLSAKKELHAGDMIRKISGEIEGGGGGSGQFATAGGRNAAGIEKALAKVEELVLQIQYEH